MKNFKNTESAQLWVNICQQMARSASVDYPLDTTLINQFTLAGELCLEWHFFPIYELLSFLINLRQLIMSLIFFIFLTYLILGAREKSLTKVDQREKLMDFQWQCLTYILSSIQSKDSRTFLKQVGNISRSNLWKNSCHIVSYFEIWFLRTTVSHQQKCSITSVNLPKWVHIIKFFLSIL